LSDRVRILSKRRNGLIAFTRLMKTITGGGGFMSKRAVSSLPPQEKRGVGMAKGHGEVWTQRKLLSFPPKEKGGGCYAITERTQSDRTGEGRGE